MPYVTTWERNGMFKLLASSLRAKFGEQADELIPVIEELNDAEKYLELGRVVATAETLDEVRRACAPAAAPPPRRKRGSSDKRGPAKK